MPILQSGEFLFLSCDAILHTSKYSVSVTVLELYQHNHTTFTFLTTEKLRRAVCLTACCQLSLASYRMYVSPFSVTLRDQNLCHLRVEVKSLQHPSEPNSLTLKMEAAHSPKVAGQTYPAGVTTRMAITCLKTSYLVVFFIFICS
jgi:hypothetical protein